MAQEFGRLLTPDFIKRETTFAYGNTDIYHLHFNNQTKSISKQILLRSTSVENKQML